MFVSSSNVRPLVALAILFIGIIASPAQADPVEMPFGLGLEVAVGEFASRGTELSTMIGADDRIARLVAPVAGLDEARQVDYVQAVVGQMIAWRSDRQLYGTEDRWVGPRQTLARRAGDCEDIAILKLASLANLGISPDRLALVVGRDGSRGDHAIAAVRIAQGWRLLDEGPTVRTPGSYAAFAPVYVLAGGKAYLIGQPRGIRTAAR